MKRASLIGLAFLLCSSTAAANGRFPESNHLVFSKADPDLVLLRVTFGLLVSHDRGKTFDYVCENAVGFTQNEDPMYTVTPSKDYVGATFEGVTSSRDQGCTWNFEQNGTEPDGKPEVFIDLAADPSDATHIVAFSSAYDTQRDGQILFKSRIFDSTDQGKTWKRVEPNLDPALLGYTVDLTKSDPQRIYLTATRNPGVKPSGFVLVSKDRGLTWSEEQIPFEFVGDDSNPDTAEKSLYIAGVDPNDAERVYVRTAASGKNPKTHLFVREAGADGGPGTWKIVHAADGPLSGFAMTPDGSKIYVGGPQDGLWSANSSDLNFTKLAAINPTIDAGGASIEVGCLGINDDGLFACSNERSGFALGFSKDNGATFEPRLHFCDLQTVLSCGADTTLTKECPKALEAVRAGLGCFDAGVNTGDGSVTIPTTTPGAEDDGCSCHVGSEAPWGAFASGGVAVLALYVVRRRRRR